MGIAKHIYLRFLVLISTPHTPTKWVAFLSPEHPAEIFTTFLRHFSFMSCIYSFDVYILVLFVPSTNEGFYAERRLRVHKCYPHHFNICYFLYMLAWNQSSCLIGLCDFNVSFQLQWNATSESQASTFCAQDKPNRQYPFCAIQTGTDDIYYIDGAYFPFVKVKPIRIPRCTNSVHSLFLMAFRYTNLWCKFKKKSRLWVAMK